MTSIKEKVPGLVAIVIISGISFYISTIHASFDALVTSIISGIFIGNIAGNREYLKGGLDAGIKVLLPVGIALYGMQLSIQSMSPALVVSICIVFGLLFGGTLLLSRIFHLNRSLSTLLAAGLSVCGASAITIISPLIGAKKEDTSIAILAVMMLGLFGMIFYPILNDFFPLSPDEFNFLAGTTLPMIGQVKVAAGAVCPDCTNAALQIKLIRVSFLLFLVPVLMFRAQDASQKLSVPWFILVFIILAVSVNAIPILRTFEGVSKAVSTLCFSAGLAAIGFSVDLDAVIRRGLMPLGVIALSWTVVLIFIYLFRSII